jgi:hypothetical protein
VVLENVLDKILGIDFIRQLALIYNACQANVFSGTPPIDNENLQAQKKIFVDALCSRKIKLRCLHHNNQKM